MAPASKKSHRPCEFRNNQRRHPTDLPKTPKVVGPIANLLGLHELLTYPLTSVDIKIDMGAGNITISNCVAGSSSFEASVEGIIPIANVLSNSPLNLPVQILLSRSLAQNISLAPAGMHEDAAQGFFIHEG